MVEYTLREVSFVSDCYGGSVSDRQIIENICNNSMFDSGDNIMADRGIMVQDMFVNQNVYVNTPTMLKNKSKFKPKRLSRIVVLLLSVSTLSVK